MSATLVTCKYCSRQFEIDSSKADGLLATRCECGQTISLGGRGLQRLGKYLLLRKLAVGGMGEIFYGMVSGIEGFEREVAIKKMLPHLSQDRSFIDMMIKEAKLTVLLNHPNIVQVYDLAREGDQYYIAMEYVPGVTIAHIIQQAIKKSMLLPVPVVVHIISQLLRGLMYAHHLSTPQGQTSIIHRDITPQNVLITQRAAVKITDFGIARAVNEISTTSPGLIKGKMGYMAPEQLAGHAPSPQVDLFCASIVAWEMLAGRRLFKGTTEVDTFRLISAAEVPDLRTLRGDIPTALWDVLKQSLAPEPDRRFATGDDLAAALLRALAPQSADELRLASEQFFREQRAMFQDVYQPDGSSPSEPPAPTELTAVTTLLRRLPDGVPSSPPTQVTWLLRRPYLVAASVAALVVAAVGSAYGLYRQSNQPAAVALASRLSEPASPPSTPPGATAPPPAAPVAAQAQPVAQPTPAPPKPADDGNGAAKPRASGASAMPAHSGKKAKPKRRAEPVDEKPLTGGEIQKVVAEHQAQIARCLRGLDAKTAPKEVAAKLTIARNGKVDQVHFDPEFAGEQGTCVLTALKALRFRPHPYEGLQVTIPLRLQVF